MNQKITNLFGLDEQVSIQSQLFSKVPKFHFNWRINKNKFNKMVDLILENYSKALLELINESFRGWKELIFYVCSTLSKKEIMIELKEEMEDFQDHLKMSCLAGNKQMVEYFISCGAECWDQALN